MCTRGVLWRYESSDAIDCLTERRNFLEAVREHRDWEVDDEAAKVVFTELVANVVRHAPGPIEVTLECDGCSLLLNVSDRGSGFAYEPKLPENLLAEGGRGLYIVSRLATEVRIEVNKRLGLNVAAKLPARKMNNRAARSSGHH
ncbi:MAG: ATP-binding protein [Candidatus Eremiobacteraeota bacterium]|nr:ATP-binding protein [Candidatus Eremiobacteraeota bacterium]